MSRSHPRIFLLLVICSTFLSGCIRWSKAPAYNPGSILSGYHFSIMWWWVILVIGMYSTNKPYHSHGNEGSDEIDAIQVWFLFLPAIVISWYYGGAFDFPSLAIIVSTNIVIGIVLEVRSRTLFSSIFALVLLANFVFTDIYQLLKDYQSILMFTCSFILLLVLLLLISSSSYSKKQEIIRKREAAEREVSRINVNKEMWERERTERERTERAKRRKNRKPPKCSICRKPGHDKRKCPNQEFNKGHFDKSDFQKYDLD